MCARERRSNRFFPIGKRTETNVGVGARIARQRLLHKKSPLTKEALVRQQTLSHIELHIQITNMAARGMDLLCNESPQATFEINAYTSRETLTLPDYPRSSTRAKKRELTTAARRSHTASGRSIISRETLTLPKYLRLSTRAKKRILFIMYLIGRVQAPERTSI